MTTEDREVRAYRIGMWIGAGMVGACWILITILESLK